MTGVQTCALPILDQARRLLLDRRAKDGGWNYGNPRIFGQELPSVPAPTAWALLALQALGQPLPDALPVLKERAQEAPGSLSLAMAAIATQKLGGDATPLLEPLWERMGTDGLRGRVDWTALAVTALAMQQEKFHAFG